MRCPGGRGTWRPETGRRGGRETERQGNAEDRTRCYPLPGFRGEIDKYYHPLRKIFRPEKPIFVITH
jgi:hypothetical protein